MVLIWGHALKMNRDHSVIFEIASKYHILDSFADCEVCVLKMIVNIYSIVSK